MNTLSQWRRQCRATLTAAVLDVPPDAAVGDTLRRGLALLPPVAWKPGGLVCVKPNLTTGKSAEGSAITTPRDIVAAVIEEINRATVGACDIAIVESDSDGRIAETYRALGYDALAARWPNVRLVDLGREKSYKVIMPDWCKARMIEVPEILLQMDHFVNVANLKRHIQERVTFTWKNIYGLPSNHLVRMRYHQFLCPLLFDLNYLFWPDWAVIDARVGLGGTGPMTGYPVEFGKLIVAANPLAADLAGMRVIGESHRRVPSLRHAARRLRVRAGDVRLVGDAFSPRRLPFVPAPVFWAVRVGLWLRKFASYFENLSLLTWLAGIALRMGKPTDFAGGGVQSLGASLKVAWRFTRTVDLSEKVYE